MELLPHHYFIIFYKYITILKIFNTRFELTLVTAKLIAAFSPSVKASLDKVNATKYYGDMVTKYNSIPLVKKINPDLHCYNIFDYQSLEEFISIYESKLSKSEP